VTNKKSFSGTLYLPIVLENDFLFAALIAGFLCLTSVYSCGTVYTDLNRAVSMGDGGSPPIFVEKVELAKS